MDEVPSSRTKQSNVLLFLLLAVFLVVLYLAAVVVTLNLDVSVNN